MLTFQLDIPEAEDLFCILLTPSLSLNDNPCNMVQLVNITKSLHH